jgi:hypothetical protein
MRNLGGALINLKRFLIVTLLEQCQPQAVKGLGVIRHFLQRFAIGNRGFSPFLIPGSRMAFIH